MDTALGRPIAYGRTAEIYAWKEDWILKLFHDWFPADGVNYEAQLAEAVHAAGLPVPAVGEVIEVNGRLGLVYERVHGVSMLDRIRTRPWALWRLAHLLAELHVEMHIASLQSVLPAQRQRIEEKIRSAEGLGADLRQVLLAALARLPDGDRLCHGDFHPGNVILTSQGPVVIDWIDGTTGNPLADVARTSIILLGVRASGDGAPWSLKAMTLLSRWFHRAYLRRYFELVPKGEEEYAAWRPIVAAARMNEGIAELQDWLLAEARAGLA